MIDRKQYLDKLIKKKENGLVKVITGIRRCGKSYLLFNIYYNYLKSIGVDDKHIITISLEENQNAKYRNPIYLDEYIKSKLQDDKMHYVFLDEIQKVKSIKNPYLEDDRIGFVDVLLELMKKPNVDLYVTGSNSKMLSLDILTEFRGRGDEIRINPLSYKEFYDAYKKDKNLALEEYSTYGGMPFIMSLETHEDKRNYLTNLFEKVYLSDILERHNLKNDKKILDDLLDIISSSIGSLTNPSKLSNTFLSLEHVNIKNTTISNYLDYFIDAFMISKAQRYDIKGKKYMETPLKYYFSDIGLRNARLNFKQQEKTHIMENIIYNELLIRGFSVDVGIVEYNFKSFDGKSKKTQLEVDFIANKGSNKYYIQSAFAIPTKDKRMQETKAFSLINDSFKKIVIVRENIIPWHDENGILYVGVEQFLLEDFLHD